MTNKYPTNDPTGKTGEEFLESIASSLRELPSIKYLADEVSKLKKSSKFATASGMNTYGTGGFVTPPPPNSTTSNKVSFFASDMNWYSDIKGSILLDNIPENANDNRYYILSSAPNSSQSIDTAYKRNNTYMQLIEIDSNTTGILSNLNDADLGTYYNSSVVTQGHISRFIFGDTIGHSETKIGDFVNIISNRNNNAGHPTSAIVMGNLAFGSGSTYKPYVAKVINNDFTLYRNSEITSFGSASIIKVAPHYTDESTLSSLRKQWYFNTSDERYIGLVMNTPFIVQKGTIYHSFQTAAKDTNTASTKAPGGYQRYANGMNTIIAKNGISMINAQVNNQSGDLTISDELTVTMNGTGSKYITQYGNIILGSLNKPSTLTRNDIGDRSKFSLHDQLIIGKVGTFLSSNLHVNSNVIAIRALNDGTADSLAAEVQNLPSANSSLFGKVYCTVKTVSGRTTRTFYRCQITPSNTYAWKQISETYTEVPDIASLPSAAKALLNKVYCVVTTASNGTSRSYYRCKKLAANRYDWVAETNITSFEYGMNWGSQTWSTRDFNRSDTAQLRFYGPYDRRLAYNDTQGLFFDRRILNGNIFMGIDVNNATQIGRFSSVSYDYSQTLRVMSWLNNIGGKSIMPEPLPTNAGEIYRYTGTDTTEWDTQFVNGHIYHCESKTVNGETIYYWNDITGSIAFRTGSKSLMEFRTDYTIQDSDCYLATLPKYRITLGTGVLFDANNCTFTNMGNIDSVGVISSQALNVNDTAFVKGNLSTEAEMRSRTISVANDKFTVNGNATVELNGKFNVRNNTLQFYDAENNGVLTVKSSDPYVNNSGPGVAITGGAFYYLRTSAGSFYAADPDGSVQGSSQSGELNRFFVRPTIITNTAPTSWSTAAKNSAPNGVIVHVVPAT